MMHLSFLFFFLFLFQSAMADSLFLSNPVLDSTCLSGATQSQVQLQLIDQLQLEGFSTVDSAQLELRIASIHNGNSCQFSLNAISTDFQTSFSTELSKEYNPADSLILMRIAVQAVKEFSRRWTNAMFGSLKVFCDSVPALVQIAGIPDSQCPAVFSKLPKGILKISISSPDWVTHADSVIIVAGQTQELRVTLQRTKAWTDSVANAQKRARSDSLLQDATQSPSQALSTMFARLFSVPIAEANQTIAVLPFTISGVKTSSYDPGLMAAEYAIATLKKDFRFQVVERQNLDKILMEKDLANSDLVTDSTAAEKGKLISAQWIVVGSVSLGNGTQTFFSKLVNVQTGEIVSAATATVGEETLQNLYRESIGERLQVSSVLFRSAVAPGWGHFFTNHTRRGVVWSTLFLGAAGYAIWRGLDYRDQDETLDQYERHDPSTVVQGETQLEWENRANKAVDRRNQAATQLNIAGGILCGVWIANILDAWWIGAQEAKRIKNEYFLPQLSVVPTPKGPQIGLMMAGGF